MNTSSLYKQILGFLSHRQSSWGGQCAKESRTFSSSHYPFYLLSASASVNGNVVQHITTVLEPGAANYTGI